MAGTQTSYYGVGFGLDEPFYLGTTGTSTLVPGQTNVSVGGRSYVAETSFEPYRRDAFRSDSIEPIADKTDINNIPGESSVNTEGLWRRGMTDFGDGAGQQFLDRDGSKANRFLRSKGIYPWQQWQASMLNDTTAVHSSGAELQVLVAGNTVYINDNGTIRYSTTTLASWSTLSLGASTAALNNAAIATDGNNVYIATGANGIYLVTSPGGTAAQWITGTVDRVWYAGGWLLAAHNNLLYNVTESTGTAGPTALTAAGPSAATALIDTANNTNFVWNCAAAGNSWVYVSGATSNTGANFSIIYKTQANTAGTQLQVPIVAATLPGGELVYSLFAYANFILVGTSLGARFSETLGLNDPGGNAGDLKLGPIVPDQIQQVAKPVKAFTGQFRFVWFGWSNYDAISTGLGRMDLSTFIDQQAPAYTSDLMVTGSGEITSMDWYNGLNNVAGVTTGSPIFVVSGLGVYSAAGTFVPQGVMDSGNITYGLPDQKLARLFSFNARGTAGSVAAVITADQGNSYTLANQPVANALSEITLPTSLKGELFDVQVQLNSGLSNTISPVLTRFMMKSLPCVVSGTLHKVIINLFATEETLGPDIFYDPYDHFSYLDGLRQSQTPVQYVEGTRFNITVVITSITRLVYNERGGPEGGFNQRLELWLKTLEN